jgi:hypothetical protein
MLMENSLLHIGLHVLEQDVKNFYSEILSCETKRIFVLQAADVNSFFGLNKEVTVQLVSCSGIDFELFIDGKIDSSTFGHVCFQSADAEKIFEKAKEGGYKTFVRKRNSNETYFISDSNHNLFEIKNVK